MADVKPQIQMAYLTNRTWHDIYSLNEKVVPFFGYLSILLRTLRRKISSCILVFVFTTLKHLAPIPLKGKWVLGSEFLVGETKLNNTPYLFSLILFYFTLYYVNSLEISAFCSDMNKQNDLKLVDWRDNIKPRRVGHGATAWVSEMETQKLIWGFTVLAGEGNTVLKGVK